MYKTVQRAEKKNNSIKKLQATITTMPTQDMIIILDDINTNKNGKLHGILGTRKIDVNKNYQK